MAIAVDVGVMNRFGARILTQPAVSGEYPGLTERQIVRAGLVGVHRTGRHAFGHLGGKDDRPPVVEGTDEIAVLDAAGRGVLGVDAHDPVAVAVDEDAVVLDLVQPALLGVAHGVEAEPRMRRDHLQRVLAVELLGVVAFPRGDVLRAHGRALGIDEPVSLEALEAAGHELDLAGRGLEALEPDRVGRMRAPVGVSLTAALGEPAHGRRRLVVFREGDAARSPSPRTPPS